MKLDINKKDALNIPNILTYIRAACIPAFIVIFFSKFDNHVYYALGIFLFASFTDMIDGKIARKYNMVSDIGKAIDPLADKLLQMSVIICLTVGSYTSGGETLHYIPWIMPVLLCVKELYMIIGGVLLVNRNIVGSANVWGKIAAFTLAIGLIGAFFNPLSEAVRIIDLCVVGLGLVFAYIAVSVYTYKVYVQLKGKDLKTVSDIKIKY